MARLKLSFDSYRESGQPTKSLINFLMKNGSLYFAINEKDGNYQWSWEPYLCGASDGVAISSAGDNKYCITFDPEDEWKEGEIVFIRGTIANETGKSYTVNDEVYRVSSELNVEITADDSTYTDFANLQVYWLPDIVSVTGNIRLNHYPVRSDYDLCIPIYDEKTATLPTYPIYATATSEELNGLSAVANSSISHLKIEFQKCEAEESGDPDEIKMSLYDGETLLGFVSWQESVPAYVNILEAMQLETNEADPQETHYVGDYVHFFDFDQALDFSSLTDYESVIEMNFTGREEQAQMFLPTDYYEASESPFYECASPIKKSSTSLKLFDRFKNIYTHTIDGQVGTPIDDLKPTDSEPVIGQPISRILDVLFAKINEAVNIPVTFEVDSTVTEPNDLIPYSELAKVAISSQNNVDPTCRLSLDAKDHSSEKNPIVYQLRTTSFVIKYNNSQYVLTNAPAYYKIGICALDGTQESTNALVNELKTSSMLTEEWIETGKMDIPIIALSKYVPSSSDETTPPQYYYCVGKSTTTDKTSMIKMHAFDSNIAPDSYISVPYNALVPITKVNESTSAKELKGLMFLQLCNTDGTEITTDFNDVMTLAANAEGTSTEGTIKCFDLIDHDIEGGAFIPSREVGNISLPNIYTTGVYTLTDTDKLSPSGYWKVFWEIEGLTDEMANYLLDGNNGNSVLDIDINKNAYFNFDSNSGEPLATMNGALTDFTMSGDGGSLMFMLYGYHVDGGLAVTPAGGYKFEKKTGIPLTATQQGTYHSNKEIPDGGFTVMTAEEFNNIVNLEMLPLD